MTQIKISIDCDGEYCGDCSYFKPESWGYSPDMCKLFFKKIGFNEELINDGKENFKRCSQCLAATVEE